MGRTALELVGQGTLGYSFDPLTADSRDEYAEAVKAFMYAPVLPRCPSLTVSLQTGRIALSSLQIHFPVLALPRSCMVPTNAPGYVTS